MNIDIRRAATSQIDDMFEVTSRAHLTGYDSLIPKDHWDKFQKFYADKPSNRERFQRKIMRYLEDSSYRVWVAVVDDLVVGYAVGQRLSMSFVRNQGLFVRPEYQGKGIGTKLFIESMKFAGDSMVELAVLEQNTSAQRLYRRYGFRVTGYSDKEFFGARQVIMQANPAENVKKT